MNNPYGARTAPIRVHAGLTAEARIHRVAAIADDHDLSAENIIRIYRHLTAAEGLGAEVTADSLRAAMTPTDTGRPA